MPVVAVVGEKLVVIAQRGDRADSDRLFSVIEVKEPSDLLLLILTRVEGLKVSEIAEVLDMSPESSARLLERAEGKLSQRLSGEDPNETGGAATCGG